MSILQEDRQRDATAARLRALIPTIMLRWEAGVREEIEAARTEERLLLFDDIPQILEDVAQALAIGQEQYCADSEATRAHAVQRVGLDAYSLDEIVHEYRVLRRVALQVLRAETVLTEGAAELVHATLDRSIQEAVTRYAWMKQQELRESEERYRLLVDGVKDYGIFLLDPHGCITSWNEGAGRIFGYTGEEITGKHFACFFTEEEGQAGLPARELEDTRERGKSEVEGWRVRKGGTRFWANSVITTLRHPSGELRGFAKVTRDITERKYLEDQLLQTADDLSQADRRKSEFLAMVAHELRTPLSAINNSLYILENVQLDERALRQLQAANRQTRQLARLVEDLMDVSRINAGKIELRREPVALCRVAQDAVLTVRPFIDARGQELECALSPGTVLVLGDAARLEQVFTNLLNNASKYTEPGGRIFLGVECEGDQVLVRVRDTGVGIDPAVLPTVFDLFYQIDPSEARSHGGLGIGLSLVNRLVEMHGGSVTALSDGVGRGSEFVVCLPLHVPAGGSAEKAAEPPP